MVRYAIALSEAMPARALRTLRIFSRIKYYSYIYVFVSISHLFPNFQSSPPGNCINSSAIVFGNSFTEYI
jgi:hypothetical protein